MPEQLPLDIVYVQSNNVHRSSIIRLVIVLFGLGFATMFALFLTQQNGATTKNIVSASIVSAPVIEEVKQHNLNTYEGKMFKTNFHYEPSFGNTNVVTKKIMEGGELFCLTENVSFEKTDWKVFFSKGNLECAGAFGGKEVDSYIITSKDWKSFNVFITENVSNQSTYNVYVTFGKRDDLFRSIRFSKTFEKTNTDEIKQQVKTMISSFSLDTSSMRIEESDITLGE